MFKKGQAVECVDAKMEGVGDCLTKGKVYHVEEFVPTEECQGLSENNVCKWNKEGGRIAVAEEPKCYFFGRRFRAVAN